MGDFGSRHQWLSTSPESGFVKVLTAQRRDATGVDILRGLTLIRLGEGASRATLETPAQLVDALGDVFGLDLAGHERQARTRLWHRTHTAHVAWLATASG